MKHSRAKFAMSAAALAMLCGVLHADDLEKAAQAEYIGKVLTLRKFYEGSQLHFDANGQLVGMASTGPWRTSGQIQIDSVRVDGNKLKLVGRRCRIAYDPSSKQFRDIARLSADDPLTAHLPQFGSEKWKEFQKDADVEVDIDLPLPANQAAIDSAVNAAFLGPKDELADFVPAFWQNFLLKQSGKPARPAAELVSPLVGGAVTPPSLIYQADPRYSEEARKASYSGTSAFWVVVTSTGNVGALEVVRPLGLGLDEQGAAAIGAWRFKPAQKAGKPIDVRISVEVNFHLN
jgi:TonB family protein